MDPCADCDHEPFDNVAPAPMPTDPDIEAVKVEGHPEAVRVVREAIRHLFPLLDDGDCADGWSDAYAVVAALTAAALLAPAAPKLTEEDEQTVAAAEATLALCYRNGERFPRIAADDLLAIIRARLSSADTTEAPEEGSDGGPGVVL